MTTPSSTPSSGPEFPPLLPPGRQVMTIVELRGLCVGGYPLSHTRANIMLGLEAVIDRLRADGVVGEVWVDGSFTTQKIDPADVDIVLRVQASFYNIGTPEQRAAIDWLQSDLKTDYLCDSYVLFEWPESHPNYWFGEYLYAYWMRQWGFSRSDVMKGIAVIDLPGGGT